MGIIISETRQEPGKKAVQRGTEIIRQAILERCKETIIIPAGASQFEMLRELENGDIDWFIAVPANIILSGHQIESTIVKTNKNKQFCEQLGIYRLPRISGNIIFIRPTGKSLKGSSMRYKNGKEENMGEICPHSLISEYNGADTP